MVYHIWFTDVDFLVMVFLEMIGQKFAICPSINSRWATFCAVVHLMFSETSSVSSRKPHIGKNGDFFCHVKPSAKNGAKLGSKERVYWRFCLHASKDIIVSSFDKDHCFGVRVVDISKERFYNDTTSVKMVQSVLTKRREECFFFFFLTLNVSKDLGRVGNVTLPPHQ